MLARLRSEYANLIQRIHRILFADFLPKITNDCQFSFLVNTMNTMLYHQRIHKRLKVIQPHFVKMHKKEREDSRPPSPGAFTIFPDSGTHRSHEHAQELLDTRR